MAVSTIGFGGSPIGSVFRPVSQTEADAAVRTALDAGINYFDTSPYYGATAAETALGRALRGVPRERYVLATKAGRYGGPATFDFSAARVTAGVDESLARLGCGHIDLLQVHDLEFGARDQIVEETLPALQRLREAGKIRGIGITGLPLTALRAVWERARNHIDAVLSYCHLTMSDDTFLPWARELRAAGVGVINAAPLAMGLLTNAGPPAWHPAPEPVRTAAASAAEWCRARGVNLADLALSDALARDEVDCTVIGFASAAEVTRAVAALTREPAPALSRAVKAMFDPVRNVTWPSGRAENN